MRFWRRVPSLVSLVVLFAGVASGCRDRVWDFGYQVIAPDGGAVDAPKVDGAVDRVGLDLGGFGGFGGFGGSGMRVTMSSASRAFKSSTTWTARRR
jgi:hypothetical protein